jgi:hypothetical protein
MKRLNEEEEAKTTQHNGFFGKTTYHENNKDENILKDSIKCFAESIYKTLSPPQMKTLNHFLEQIEGDCSSLNESFSWLPIKCRENVEFALNVVKLNGLCLKYVSKGAKLNQEIILAAIKQNPRAFEYAHYSFRKKSENAISVIKVCPDMIYYASPLIRTDRTIIKEVIQKTPELILGFSEDIQLEFAKFVLETKHKQLMAQVIHEDHYRTIIMYEQNITDFDLWNNLFIRLPPQIRYDNDLVDIGLRLSGNNIFCLPTEMITLDLVKKAFCTTTKIGHTLCIPPLSALLTGQPKPFKIRVVNHSKMYDQLVTVGNIIIENRTELLIHVCSIWVCLLL